MPLAGSRIFSGLLIWKRMGGLARVSGVVPLHVVPKPRRGDMSAAGWCRLCRARSECMNDCDSSNGRGRASDDGPSPGCE